MVVFFTPKPLGRWRNVFAASTWIVLALMLVGLWAASVRNSTTSTATAGQASTLGPMTEAELQARARELDAALDRSDNGFMRNDSVVAGPGLTLTYTTVFPRLTAAEAQALPVWPELQKAVLARAKSKACSPTLPPGDLMQRGVTRIYEFRGRDGASLLHAEISRAGCKPQH